MIAYEGDKRGKRDYIQALIDSREQDNDAVFINIMMHMQERHLRQEIMTFCRSMQEGVEIATQVDRKGGQKNDSGGQKTRDAIVVMIRLDIGRWAIKRKTKNCRNFAAG